MATTKKPTKKEEVTVKQVPVEENLTEIVKTDTEAETPKEVETPKKVEPPKAKYTEKDIDFHEKVTCINGTNSLLVYSNPRTQETTRWEGFGSEELLEVQDLISMKNTQPKFFSEHWLLIDKIPEPVVEYLGLQRFYKDALSYSDFETIYTLPPAEIKAKLAKVSKGTKEAVIWKTRRKMQAGELDSLKTIAAIEEALKVSLRAD